MEIGYQSVNFDEKVVMGAHHILKRSSTIKSYESESLDLIYYFFESLCFYIVKLFTGFVGTFYATILCYNQIDTFQMKTRRLRSGLKVVRSLAISKSKNTFYVIYTKLPFPGGGRRGGEFRSDFQTFRSDVEPKSGKTVCYCVLVLKRFYKNNVSLASPGFMIEVKKTSVLFFG